MSETPTGQADAPRLTGALSAMRVAELQAVAAQLGISGAGKLRKPELVAAIRERRDGGAGRPARAERAPEAGAPAEARTERPAQQAQAPQQNQQDAEPRAERTEATDRTDRTDAGERPEGRRRSRRAVSAPAGAPAPRAERADDDRPVREERGADEQPARESRDDRPARDVRDSRDSRDERPARDAREDRRSRGDRSDRAAELAEELRREAERAGLGADAGREGRRDDQPGERRSRRDRDRDRRGRDEQSGERPQRDQSQGRDRGEGFRRDDEEGGGRRRGRQRNRDRKRRNKGEDYSPEVEQYGEDDVLLPVAGILDIDHNYAFVRTSGYLPGPNDVYVPMNLVKRNGLRKGDAVVGAVKAPRDDQPVNNPGQGKHSKLNALVRLDSVNGQTVEQARQRVEFQKLTPLYPQERLRLETTPNVLATRIIDLVAPIGKGQRGLIVSPPKAGKTLILQAIANAISVNNPEAHLMVVLVDERPEEVTDMQRTVKGEVIASTFDRPASDHTTVAELAIERAKRLVELGHDVVVLLDSITRLGRAYNLAAPASGRILSGGVDANALYPPKRFFGAARNIENGGSLTILATALVETGSKMDEVIFEEFKGTGNMELRLSRQLADRRIFPAVDVNPSGTRREEILMSAEEIKIMWKLRRVLSALEPQASIELLTDRLKKTKSNVEFLMQVQKTTPIPGRDDED